MPKTRQKKFHLVDPKYAVLIGEICALWNDMEDAIGYVLLKYFEDAFAWKSILSVAGNKERVELLLHAVQTKEEDIELRKCLEYLARAFSICLENRNILVHSAVRSRDSLKLSVSGGYLEKRSKARIDHHVRYPYDLKLIRRVRDEMVTILAFAFRIAMNYVIPELIRLRKIAGNELKEDWPPQPWPEIPPLPKKIEPLPPEVPQGVPPPPQSSRG